MSRAQNPLRISQESLNLDDIISDLNEGNTATVLTQESSETKSKAKLKDAVKKQPIKSYKNSSNKENLNGNDTKNSVTKSNAPKKDHCVSQMSTKEEKKAQPQQERQHSEAQTNDRYADSNFKFDSVSQAHTQDNDHLQSIDNHQETIPIYMNRGGYTQTGSITDEDVETFQKKLDTLIINFRSETMSEFMRTKKQVLQDQAQTIDAERRRCNTLLGVKQNEIEQLKESLASKTKQCDDLNIRCEIMALWAGKGKTLARVKVLQHKCFKAFKEYRDFKKHSKDVLGQKLKQYRQDIKRKVFQGWGKQYKEWKIIKNRDDFEKAVKQELQSISAQYSKEIESLRRQLDEANQIVDKENKNKAMMQENLKKAFMRGVCALNFEAMNILNPDDQNYQHQIEREMEKQVMYAMDGLTNSAMQSSNQGYESLSRSPEQQNQSQRMHTAGFVASSNNQNQFAHTHGLSHAHDYSEAYKNERKLMQIEQNADIDYKKIETKDTLWKPAPIMGREIQQPAPFFTYSQPQITSNLRSSQQQQNYVLPSHFSRAQEEASVNFQQNEQQTIESIQPVKLDTNTDDRVVQNAQVITNSSSLPDFVHSNLPTVNQTHSSQVEGKTIYAGVNTTQAKGRQPTNTSNKKGMNSTAVSQSNKRFK